MKLFSTVIACFALSAIVLLGCNLLPSSLTDSDSSDDVPQALGAAIGAAFSGGGGGASNAAGAPGTCSDFEGDGGGPDGVTVDAHVTPGTYGPTGASVTVASTDDCEDDNTNAEAFAAFSMDEGITATCTSGNTITLMSGSAGVYRNNDALGYYPQVYGTFHVSDGNGNTWQSIHCAIFLNDQEVVVEATCEDADGNSIETDTSTDTCQFDTTN